MRWRYAQRSTKKTRTPVRMGRTMKGRGAAVRALQFFSMNSSQSGFTSEGLQKSECAPYPAKGGLIKMGSSSGLILRPARRGWHIMSAVSSLPSKSPHRLPRVSRRYSLRRELGSGSLGTVYLALDRVRGKLVALKILRVERLGESAIASIRTEFQAVASLRHPRLAAAYDFGYSETGRIPFYTREFIPATPVAPG